jgi:hypothetical protein
MAERTFDLYILNTRSGRQQTNLHNGNRQLVCDCFF